MASLAFSLIGSAIGASVLGPGAIFLGLSGSTIGGFIGSALGGMLTSKDVNLTEQGPRLFDLKVQAASYGQSIPVVYGRARLAGNLIWSSDIIEETHTSSQSGGGKGGGESTVTTTTYSYKAHLAVGICEGPIIGIRRIWANGKLIYNVGASADADTISASNDNAFEVRFYLGSATQAVDALIESYEGVGSVPAYRNVAYVVLEGFQLADYGNRIPNFEFEVTSSATTDYLATLSTYATRAISSGTVDAGLFDLITAYSASVNGATLTITHNRIKMGMDGTLHSTVANTASVTNYSANGAYQIFGNWHGLVLYKESGESAWTWFNFADNTVSDPWWDLATLGVPTYAFKFDTKGVVIATLGVTVILYQVDISGGGNYPTRLTGTQITVPSVGANFHAYLDNTSIWVTDTMIAAPAATFREYDGLAVTLTATYGPVTLHFDNRPFAVFEKTVALGRTSVGGETTMALYSLNADYTMTELQTEEVETARSTIFIGSNGVLAGDRNTISITGTLVPSTVTTATIVTALCGRAGLAASDITVTSLTDAVTGYVIGKRGTLRSAIEPLMQAYFFDAVESEGVLKFVKRGTASAITFVDDDMDARPAGTPMGDIVSHERQQELELPIEISVLFFNDTAAYEQGAQYARRLVSQADGRGTLELPLVLTDTQAKSIADSHLFDGWVMRDKYSWRTGREYMKYEPTDVVTIPVDDDSVEVRITKRDDGGNGVIAWEGVATDASVYTQTATTQTAVAPDSTFTLPGPTNMEMMDIPMLRDADDFYGLYCAVNGYLEGWRGAQIFKSLDGGGTYDNMEQGTFTTEATMGYAESVLGTVATYFDQFDEAGTVDVFCINGTLSTATRAQVLNGSNVALLGSEIIQFRTATLVSAGHYTLTGLLRGRLGTEWAVGTHAVNERFVMLSATTARFLLGGPGDINVERKFKAVTFNNRIADAIAEAVTYAGVNIKPLSPVQVSGGRDATGNVTINWKRRTRMNATWRDYADVPLGETTEAYEVDILGTASPNMPVRTLTTTTNSATYTIAQQTTDFGSPVPSTISVNVYQMSSRLGRGYVAQATF